MSSVDSQTILQYLLEQGVPREHAIGMVNNIYHESGFRPGINEQNPIVAGSRGGYGLFQHTGPRRRALESYAQSQNKPVSDWQVQLDFALSEPDTKRYLSESFKDPASASSWFTQHWERPQNAAEKARQRLSTLNQFAPDVRQAGGDYGPGSTDTDRTPTGNPMTGRMDMTFDDAQQEPLGIHPQLQALIQGQQPDKRTQILNLVGALGRGILNSGGGPGAGNWFGNAANQAFAELAAQRPDQLNALQMLQANNELWQLEESRRERQLKRKQRMQQEAYLRDLAENHSDPSVRFQAEQQLMGVEGIDLPGVDDWKIVGTPSKGGVYRVNPTTREHELLIEPVETADAATYGTGANWLRAGEWEDGTPKWQMVRLNDAGEEKYVTVPKGAQPWSGLQNDPSLVRERAAARAEGAAAGEKTGEIVASFPEIEQRAQASVTTIDQLLADREGMRRAVGFLSQFPTIPGGAAADYEARLNQLYGQNFLKAYQELKGGGQITEIEGQKAEQAIAALAKSQSVEEHMRELQRLREVIISGYERARNQYMPNRQSIFSSTESTPTESNSSGRNNWKGFRVIESSGE